MTNIKDWINEFMKGKNTHQILADVDGGRLKYYDFVRKSGDEYKASGSNISEEKHFLRSKIAEIEEALNKFAKDNVILEAYLEHGTKGHINFVINYHEERNYFEIFTFGVYKEEDKEVMRKAIE